MSSGVFFVVPSSVNPAVDGRDLGVLCGDLEVVKVFRGNLDEGEEAVDEGVECEPGVRLEGLRLVADGEVDVEVGLCCDLELTAPGALMTELQRLPGGFDSVLGHVEVDEEEEDDADDCLPFTFTPVWTFLYLGVEPL